MLVLSYLGILALIPLLMKKDDTEVQWHAKNGLGLTVAWILLWIVIAIVEHFMPVDRRLRPRASSTAFSRSDSWPSIIWPS